MNFRTINPQQLNQLIVEGKEVELIDVHTPAEFRAVHVPFARNVPLDQLSPSQITAGRSSNSPLYVICRSGARGKKACEQLLAAGCNCVINVEGGTLAWDQACLPVVRGKSAISLERQVRIIAGLSIVLGAVLAIASGNSLWALLSGVMGAGLAHAGISESCAMGMMLAQMPWNKVRPNTQLKVES